MRYKAVVLFVSIMCISYSAQSQVLISLLFGDMLNSDKIEFGLEGGLNWSGLSGSDATATLLKFNLGFYFDIKLNDPSWMVYTGVIVKSNMGAKGLSIYSLDNKNLDTLFAGGSITREFNYFNVPVELKYRFSNGIYLKGGIQLGLMYNAYDNFVTSINDDDDLNYALQVRDKYHPIDGGFVVGAGYDIPGPWGMHINGQYYRSIIDMEVDDSGPGMFNSVFYVTLAIPIGKKSPEEKPKE